MMLILLDDQFDLKSLEKKVKNLRRNPIIHPSSLAKIIRKVASNCCAPNSCLLAS
jgi:hypothetical protein